MKEARFSNFIDLFSQFRNVIEDLFESRLSIRLTTEELGAAIHPNSILLVGEITDRLELETDTLSAEETGKATERSSVKKLVGKHVDLQGFFNKDEPPYSEEFMLDLEFDYDSGTCTIHHINLPYFLRDKGSGSKIIREIESFCRLLGLKNLYVPAEHNATNFWLKQGYTFTFEHEQNFFDRNRQRKNIYIAYDLRKDIDPLCRDTITVG